MKKSKLKMELGRYQKKTADQQTEIKKLKRELFSVQQGISQLQQACDALLIQIILKQGERVRCEKKPESSGWRLDLSPFDVKETLQQFEICAEKDKKWNCYNLTVFGRNK